MECKETATIKMDGISARSKATDKEAWTNKDALEICMPMRRL
jgi:hypothetical protein